MEVSIVVPVYNVENYIYRCIDSILAQSYVDFELVLVDDGSPDNCGKICDEYAAQDKRITVIHKENGGLSDARNAGIEWVLKKSDSKWITFIDSDDWVHVQYLEGLMMAACKHNVDISLCEFARVNEFFEDEKISLSKSSVYDVESYYCAHNEVIIAWGKLYKIELFNDIRYPFGKIHEDEFTTYKLLFATDKIAVNSNRLYYYYQNPNGIMNSMWTEKNLAIIEAREEQLTFFRENKYLDAYCHLALIYVFDLANILCEKIQLLPTSRQHIVEKKVRHELRKALWKYRNEYHYKWNTWTLLVAYPLYENVLRRFHLI